MWVGHFHLKHDNCIHLANCNKFDVVLSVYPLNIHKDKEFIYYTNINVLSGSEQNKKKFISAFKKDKRTQKMEINGNQFISFLKTERTDYHTMEQYDKRMFFLQPVVHDKGYEDWVVGSWEKKVVTDFYKRCKKLFDVKLYGIKEEKNKNVFFPKIAPNLTQKQVEALELAITLGYYDFPKKIELQELAKKSGISRVTFQEHLRKAEAKLMPLLLGSVKA
ncbi:MAG: helix-turn-helix domain-containing protein [Candidatus Diapherotrites archaeon]|nr:helix-turn-helix domain-containing protein [Candidatus Diapherotrites archaeon]